MSQTRTRSPARPVNQASSLIVAARVAVVPTVGGGEPTAGEEFAGDLVSELEAKRAELESTKRDLSAAQEDAKAEREEKATQQKLFEVQEKLAEELQEKMRTLDAELGRERQEHARLVEAFTRKGEIADSLEKDSPALEAWCGAA